MSLTNAEEAIRLARRRGVLRPRELTQRGIPRGVLGRLVDQGFLERVGRGLYVVPGADVSENHTLAEACKRVPHAVVCLLSALRFHDMTTQAPFEVWMAIDRKSRKPAVDYPPIRVVRFSGEILVYGVEEHDVEGVAVHVTSPAKTVADCFKYRNKTGVDVAVEALVDYRREKKGTMDDLWSAAKVCRMTNVMRPYLDSLV